MNKAMLESFMKLKGDTSSTLASHLGIARSSFSAKMNEYEGRCFTQKEICIIKNRYNLSSDDADRIFFADFVSL